MKRVELTTRSQLLQKIIKFKWYEYKIKMDVPKCVGQSNRVAADPWNPRLALIGFLCLMSLDQSTFTIWKSRGGVII